jgi:cytochrome oxidase Cu insertion factor (SCO1/SenC/PrrC family)
MKSRTRLVFAATFLVAVGAALIFATFRARQQGSSTSPTMNASLDHASAAPVGSVAPVGMLLEEFRLTDQQGREFDSRSLDGKVWVGSVFFADCPSVCRAQNQRISELQHEFAELGVEFVSITCDPENDTPRRLADYSLIFNAQPDRWHFLTGDLALIRRIGSDMLQVAVEEEVHSDRLVVFGRDGKIAGSFRSTDRDEFLKAQVKLRELVGAQAADQGRDTP